MPPAAPRVCSPSMETPMHKYRIFGLAPEVPEGHEFRSRVADLDQRPEFWAQECPYTIGRFAEPIVVKED